MSQKEQLHIRIDPYLKEFLKEWACAKGVQMSTIILRYIREEYEKRVIRESNGNVEQL